MECSETSARVEARGKAHRYIFRLKKSQGAWGEGGWTALNDVQMLPLAVPQKDEAPAVALAPSVSPAPVAEPVIPPAPISPWTFTAIFDTYFAYNFNSPAPVTPLSAGAVDSAAIRPPQNSLRYYDWYSKQLGLNLIEFTPKYSKDGVSFLADLDFGQMADSNAAAASGSGYVVDDVSKHIGQAYLTYLPAQIPGLVIDVGKMYTHLGLETAKAKDNWNYSRSLTYSYALPFWHVGMHLGYPVVTDKVVAGLYLYNGWNTLTDLNSAPTWGAQLKFTPSSTMTVVYNFIGGPEQFANSQNSKVVHELNGTLALSPQFSLGADIAYGKEHGVVTASYSGTATWASSSLAAKWQLTPTLSLSPRAEILRDSQGYATGDLVGQTLTDYTLTLGMLLKEGFEVRVEGRQDHSTAKRFLSRNGATQDQSSALVSALLSL